jgi:hypothetical protein
MEPVGVSQDADVPSSSLNLGSSNGARVDVIGVARSYGPGTGHLSERRYLAWRMGGDNEEVQPIVSSSS